MYVKKTKKDSDNKWFTDALGVDSKSYYKIPKIENIFSVDREYCEFMFDHTNIQCTLSGKRCEFCDKQSYEDCKDRNDMLYMRSPKNRVEGGYNYLQAEKHNKLNKNDPNI